MRPCYVTFQVEFKARLDWRNNNRAHFECVEGGQARNRAENRMKKKLLIAVPLLVLVTVTAWFFRPKRELLGEAYVSEKSVTLWSGVAQVREPIGFLRHGDRVDTLAKRNDFVKVRTSSGAEGWVDGRLLMVPPAITQPGDQGVPIAGWVIARFLELDVPDAVREGANAANLRPIAWFELNHVDDPSGKKAQYLLAATRGSEGQSCDFSVLRVFTWNGKKSRYETAFIENNLCGKLPIQTDKSATGQPEFRFLNADDPLHERVYRLIQTVVRRIRDGQLVSPRARPAPRRNK